MTASTEKESEKERRRRMEDCLARLDEGVKQLLANNYKYGMAGGRRAYRRGQGEKGVVRDGRDSI